MGSISDYLENKLLDHVFNHNAYTPPSTVYLGLSLANPLDDGSGLNEPSGGNYSRKAIAFGAAASRRVTQSGDIEFSVPSAYVALATVTISDDDTGSTIAEPSGNGYGRILVSPNGGSSPAWDTVLGNSVSNADNIDIGPATGSWGTIVAVALVDAASAGNLLFYDNEVSDQEVGYNDTWRFAVGSFTNSLS